ncbi:MAG: hypothetical protein H6581_19120 [Bacteroidia bacterium]|nr:hypothetical protein [Bacteroidia bacterium]
MKLQGSYSDNVFINCPFDLAYKPLLEAIVFAVIDCGFHARTALEFDNSAQNRLDKILRIIGSSQFAIHDISRTEVDPVTQLPRFNMPFELGLFLACKSFGNQKQKTKEALVLDHTPYRYQRFMSDLAGTDIQTHNNDPQLLIVRVRDWLRTASRRSSIPGGHIIANRYLEFREELPETCRLLDLDYQNLIFNDYTLLVAEWLRMRDQLMKESSVEPLPPRKGVGHGDHSLGEE